MGSLTGKFSKGILGDFIFKAAVWRTGCFKSSVPGIRKQAMETERQQRTFVKVASLEKSGSFLPLRIPVMDLYSQVTESLELVIQGIHC